MQTHYKVEVTMSQPDNLSSLPSPEMSVSLTHWKVWRVTGLLLDRGSSLDLEAG